MEISYVIIAGMVLAYFGLFNKDSHEGSFALLFFGSILSFGFGLMYQNKGDAIGRILMIMPVPFAIYFIIRLLIGKKGK